VNDEDCTAFLQWALPRLGLRWPGFRKVRHQVCKRIGRRMSELGLADPAQYRARVEADAAEWRILDQSCHITISRFFRDRGVFETLCRRVLPDIAARAREEAREARIWSAGCASGEEAYTLKILWNLEIARSCPGVPLALVATDADPTMLARAQAACFKATSLRELPPHLLEPGFERVGSLLRVRAEHRAGIVFLDQDLRSEAPSAHFDLVLCRYVAFTYFALPLQERVLARIEERLGSGGYLAIGSHERLPPAGGSTLMPLAGAAHIFVKGTESPQA